MMNNSRWLQVLIIELVIIAALFLVQQVGGFLLQFAGIGLSVLPLLAAGLCPAPVGPGLERASCPIRWRSCSSISA